MDQKQFNRLQSAVQFAMEDASRQRHGQPPTGWRWLQGSWATGRVTKRRRKVKQQQKYWNVVCPTSGCIAGTIVIQNGDHLAVGPDTPIDADVQTDFCIDKDGTMHNIESRATELLGVSTDDLHGLFNGGQGIDAVVNITKAIAWENGLECELEQTAV